jgi:type III secretory pathway lipoprotein EscJ
MRRLPVTICLWLAACAPPIDGPLDHQRAVDRADADHLALQLVRLPGAVHADVTLHRPMIDPLTEAVTPPSAAILVVIDDKADGRAIKRSAIALVRGTAPEISEPEIVVELGATRPALASVGPFTVESQSKTRLVGAFATAFALIAALAGWIAWRERWRLNRAR